MSEVSKLIDALRDELQRKDEVIRELKDEVRSLKASSRDRAMSARLSQMDLTPTQKKIMKLLYMSPDKIVTKDQIYSELYDHKGREMSDNIVGVFVCKLRQKLDPFDVKLATVYGEGFMLTRGERNKLDAVLRMKLGEREYVSCSTAGSDRAANGDRVASENVS